MDATPADPAVTLECLRCGATSVVVMHGRDGDPIDQATFDLWLRVAGEGLICDECATPAERADPNHWRTDG